MASIRLSASTHARPARRWLPAVRARWLVAPLVVAIGLGLTVIAGIISVETTYANRVVARVHTLDVDLGGRTVDEARAVVSAQVANRLRQPITLVADDVTRETNARDLGMSLDVESLLGDAYGLGRDSAPFERAVAPWKALVWRDWQLVPRSEVDRDHLRDQLVALASTFDRPGIDARLDIVPTDDAGFAAVVTAEQPGRHLLVDPSVDRVLDQLLSGGDQPIDLVVEQLEPRVAATDLDAVQTEASRILSGPVLLELGDQQWAIPPAALARAIRVETDPVGETSISFDPTLDPAAFTSTLDQIALRVGRPAVEARFGWTGSGLSVIRESEDGWALDRPALMGRLQSAVYSDERHVTVPVALSRPRVASDDAASLGITELIKEGRTSFAGTGAEKQHNVRLAASRLNGVVVPPGATFSFNHEVGPTTIDAGFQSAWGITSSAGGHQTVPSVAGGICQVATTLFQPVFHAGYPIEQRNYHLYWIPSYGQAPLGMKGLDATVDEEYGLDLQFVNSTPDYLLIQARVDGTSLVFGLYGTRPDWTVQVDAPKITNVIAANTELVRRPESTLAVGRTVAVESAQDGFDASVTRTVTQGDDVRTLNLRSRYAPAQNVTLYGTGTAAAAH